MTIRRFSGTTVTFIGSDLNYLLKMYEEKTFSLDNDFNLVVLGIKYDRSETCVIQVLIPLFRVLSPTTLVFKVRCSFEWVSTVTFFSLFYTLVH